LGLGLATRSGASDILKVRFLAMRVPSVRIGARMPRFSFVLDVRGPTETVMAAMIDFSDRCPDIWPSLSAKIYRAHSVRENTADDMMSRKGPIFQAAECGCA